MGISLLWASVLASHYLAYFIAFPIASERAHELSHSGHGWLADATHYGLPLIIASLAVGVITRPDKSNRIRTRNLAITAGIAFASIEILERLINSATTTHPLVFNLETLIIGTLFASGFGYIISALFHEARTYILNSFGFQLPSALPAFWKPAQITKEINVFSIQRMLESSIQHRGPPLLLSNI